MAQKFNTEFNYRYQVIGCTPWEKIKTLKGFLEGRIRAMALEEVGNLKFQAKLSKLKHLQNSGNGLEHEILELKAEILEAESHEETLKEAFELTKDEIKILKKLLKELYVLAEPTRIEGYTDEEMFEANAANEFTVDIGREIQAEMIANGRPSPAKLRNAMSNPHTWNALKQIGLIPKKTKILEGNTNPQLKIELTGVEDETV
jgi:AAA+ ATPase superfamily predicted ATPase